MKKFKISAKVVSYVEKEIEAESVQKARKILADTLERGEMPEVDGWVDDEEVTEIKSPELDRMESYLINEQGWTQEECSEYTSDELAFIIEKHGWSAACQQHAA